MADGMEFKRANLPRGEEARPVEPAPAEDAPFAEREAWSFKFVPWFFSLTGGEWPAPPEADQDGGGALVGRRWRAEFFECVRDPSAFEAYAEQEIEAYKARGEA